MEERKAKGEPFHGLDATRSSIAMHGQIEHKRVNGELGELNEPGQWFRTIFDNISEGILFTDLENKCFITGNKAICQMLGYNPEEITNLKITSICSPEDSFRLIAQFEKQPNKDLVFHKDVPFRKKNGSLFYADIMSIPLTCDGKIYLINFLHNTLAQNVMSVLRQNTFLDSHASQLLTATELEVLRLIIKGMSNKEIAKLFHRSLRTVENHRAHLMKKLSVYNSIELVKQAVAMGLIDLYGEQRREKAT